MTESKPILDGNRWEVDMLDVGNHTRNYHITRFSTVMNLVATVAETCNSWASISTATASELQDFIIELVHEIERRQAENIKLNDELEFALPPFRGMNNE